MALPCTYAPIMAIVIPLIALFICPAASAQDTPPDIGVVWLAPEGCMTADAFVRAVSRMTSASIRLTDQTTAPVVMTVRIEPGAPEWTLTFVLDGNNGRRLGARTVTRAVVDCREFDETMTLIAAVAIDALAETPPASDAPKTDIEPPSVAPPPSDASPAEAAPPTARDTAVKAEKNRGISLGASFAFSYGFLPDANYGAALFAAYRILDAWSFWLEFTVWPPETERIETGEGGRFLGFTGVIEGCYAFWRDGLNICPGIGGSLIHATGVGLDRNQAETAAAVLPYLGLAYPLVLKAVLLKFGAGACLHVPTVSFSVSEGNTAAPVVHETAWVLPIISIGVGWAG